MNAQQLKNSILQMAVQGKLVPQDPNDEPASVLLERIRKEKEKLIKEGKIKKDKNPSYIFRGEDNLPYEKVGKNDPVCIADEVPFEIPDSWEWARLGTVSTYAETKKKINAKYAEPSLWGLDLEDIEKGGRLLAKLSVGERKAIGDKTVFEAGDILYSKLRPYLLKILVADEEGICTPEIVPFKMYGAIEASYIVAYLKSPYVNDTINAATYGIKMPRAGTETMTGLLVPIPPIDEQHRIIKLLNELEPSISKYDEKDQQISALNSEFPEQLKKSILQQAVMGKLVPQDPNDEPAIVLLDRIRTEKQALIKEGKLKKDKHESIIYRRDNSHYEKLDGIERCIDDEIPFDIPDTWTWARLKSLGFTQTGNTPSKSHPEYFGTDIPFIGPGDIQDYSINYNNQGLSVIGMGYGRIVSSNSILQVCIGGSIGKAAINDIDIAFNQQINAVTPIFLKHEYLYYSMISPYYVELMKSQAGGTATPIINRGMWDMILIPVPPLQEQVRIIKRIKATFVECSHL